MIDDLGLTTIRSVSLRGITSLDSISHTLGNKQAVARVPSQQSLHHNQQVLLHKATSDSLLNSYFNLQPMVSWPAAPTYRVNSANNNSESNRLLTTQDLPCVQQLSELSALKLSLSRCHIGCSCQCHSYSSLQSPSFLELVIGKLFLGYRALPWLRRTCDKDACRTKANYLQFKYTFPSWLLHRVLVMTFSYMQSQGPELLLRTMRVREDVLGYLTKRATPRHYNEGLLLEKVQRDLESGQISVLDVTQFGRTALHVRQRR